MTKDLMDFHPDYIIVGSGAGGGVLAARLAEDKNNKVLLIEAGPDNTKEQNISTAATWLYLADLPKQIAPDGSPSHLGFQTVSQKGKIYGYPRGTGLGGSTNHHAMVDGRGSPVIYDGWAKELDDPRWSGDALDHYFKKMENFDVPNSKKEAHGQDGWLHIKHGQITEEAQHELIDVIKKETGAKWREDFYDDPDDYSGVGYFDMQVHNDGRRSYVATDLLIPRYEENKAKGWDNLVIATDKLVTKVIFEGNRAVGVEVLDGPNAYQVDDRHKPTSLHAPTIHFRAKKEVILAGGSFNTPQLLMLSGVGPKEDLEKLGIQVVKDLPGVGRNVLDHMEVTNVFEFNNLPGGAWKSQAALLALEDPSWQSHADMSALTTNAVTLGWEWFSDVDARDKRYPDLHIHFLNVYFRDFNFNPETFNDPDPLKAGYIGEILKCLDSKNPKSYFSFLTEIMKVKANRGTIKLASADPTESPIIDLQLNDNEEDVTRLAKSIEMMRKLMSNPVFAKYEVKETLPGPGFEGLEGAKKYINLYSSFGHHISGTCKMGRLDDPMAVVDTNLKVIGVEGLRICDASIFPTIPGYNTSRPTYMVGEVLADRIKAGD
jgi:choline dehydrogenase